MNEQSIDVGLDVVVHIFNPSSEDVEIGGFQASQQDAVIPCMSQIRRKTGREDKEKGRRRRKSLANHRKTHMAPGEDRVNHTGSPSLGEWRQWDYSGPLGSWVPHTNYKFKCVATSGSVK